MSYNETLREFMERAQQRKNKRVETELDPAYRVLVTGERKHEVRGMDGAKKDLMQLLAKDCPNYQLTDELIEAIKAFIANRVEAETKKWFFVMGNFGSGKTYLFEVLGKWLNMYVDTKKRRHIVLSVHDLVARYKEGGDEYLYSLDNKNLCIDDVGAEREVKYYGETEDIMSRFLQLRYNRRRQVTTDIITNLTWAEFAERYGARVESRLSETAVKVKIGASKEAIDFRKLEQSK